MATSWEDLWKPPPPPVASTLPPAQPGEGRGYAVAAMQGEAEKVRSAPEGTRNHTLNQAAFNLGTLVALDWLGEAEVTDELSRAAVQAGLGPREVAQTVRSGLQAGQKHPRHVELTGAQGLTWGGPPAGSPPPLQLVQGGAQSQSSPPPPPPAPPPAGPAPTGPAEPDAGEGRQRSSWWPRPVAEVAATQAAAPAPEILFRTDGKPLLYRGRVNGVQGESESGKTMVALLAVAQVARAGGRVLFLDFEDSASTIHSRLQAMGLSDYDLSRVCYAQPDERLQLQAAADLAEAVDGGFDLTVVDGVNAALSVFGYSSDSNDDTTAFARAFLQPLARRKNSAVLTVDHVPKHLESRAKGAIGAQAKRAMVDGASYTVDVLVPFGRGGMGELRLLVDKDKLGHIRGMARASRFAGKVVLDGTRPSRLDIRIEPDSGGGLTLGMPTGDGWRPVELMEQVSVALETKGPLGRHELAREVKQRKDGEALLRATEILAGEGYIQVTNGARGKVEHRLVRPFRAADEGLTPAGSPASPGSAAEGYPHPSTTRPDLSPPVPTCPGDTSGQVKPEPPAAHSGPGNGPKQPENGPENDLSPPVPTCPGDTSGHVKRPVPDSGRPSLTGEGGRSGQVGPRDSSTDPPVPGNRGQVRPEPEPPLEGSPATSDCNTCGRQTPDRVITRNSGICDPCRRIQEYSR